MTQTVTIHPGWNAIWLEVQPDQNGADSVFDGLPLASVWTRSERVVATDFIQNPSEEAFNEAGWLGWFPPSKPESFLKNLHAVLANRAYLVKSTNTTDVVWTITGRPSLRQPEWVPDRFNLRGLAVDPSSLPDFRSFFAFSSAHYNQASDTLERIFRLVPETGRWEAVGSRDLIESGLAYWIFTRGASDFTAPLSAEVEIGDGLNYGFGLSELDLRLLNRRTTSVAAEIRDLSSGETGPLSHFRFDPATGGQWMNLPNPWNVTAASSQSTRLRVGIRRQDFVGAEFDTVLEIKDGLGTRLLVPVAGQRAQTSGSAGGGGTGGSGGNASLAGLWVGTATLDQVSEAHSSNPNTPTPAANPINLRLMLHLDEQGQVRLLREVIQMWKEGTTRDDGEGALVDDEAGSFVLLTDDTLIPSFSGAALRDGESVGRRLSSVGYDFDAGPGTNYVNMIGTLGLNQILTATLVISSENPRNPFLHKYHPDHDNLNDRFDGPQEESFAITRDLVLLFSDAVSEASRGPDFGYNELGGFYQETISGMHKRPLVVNGTFQLSRISLITEIDPEP